MLLVGQDRGQVLVSEPAGQRRGAQRLIDSGRAVQFGERHRFGHLGAHPRRAGRGGLYQPGGRAVADGQKRRLGRVGGFGGAVPGQCATPGMITGVMGVADLGSPTLPARMAGDLDRAAVLDDGDDEFLTTPAHQTRSSIYRCGTEYRTPSTLIVESHPTRRVSPNARATGWAGSTCSRGSSSTNSSAGTRPVARCGRALTWAQKSRHAC